MLEVMDMQHEQRAGVAEADDIAIDAALSAILRRRLLDELGAIAAHERVRTTTDDRLEEPEKVDVGDQQALDLERDVELILDDGSGAAADAIRAALARLDDGTFGRCVDCGETVSIARLTALPYAARCLDCQSRAERRR
jgi:RNA polymerase-binding transcription factor DksA